MWIDRLGLARLRRECVAAAEREEAAGYELALSARRFSRRARRDAEDRLAFSATLMRAGEAAAAARLVSEFESDLRADQEVLVRRVDEARAAGATRRSKMTRLRLARLLATALLTAGLLGGSLAAAMGAGLLVEPAGREGARPAAPTGAAAAALLPGRRTKVERIAGVRVAMSARQYRTYRVLVSIGDVPALEELLMDVLDGDADLAERVAGLLARAPAGLEPASIVRGASGLVPGDSQPEAGQGTAAAPDESERAEAPAEPEPGETEEASSDAGGDDDGDGSGGEEPDDSNAMLIDPSTAGI